MPAQNNKYTEFINEIRNKNFETGFLLHRLTGDKQYFSSIISLQFVIKSEYKNDYSEFKYFLLNLIKKYDLRKYYRKYRFSISAINENNYDDGEGLTLIYI